MNKKGFTLIELLGVIVILSIVMLIAMPNITSLLNKNKKATYIADAKKFITQTEYVIRNGEVEKPNSSELVKVRLSYIGNRDLSKDPDGNTYSLTDSYVIIARKDGYLEYYVNLIALDSNNNTKGIRLAYSGDLDSSNKLSLVSDKFTNPTDTEIQTIVGVSGTIKTY